jgi:CO dehydrogenase/acetyl-CoA synthase epsilon subunit
VIASIRGAESILILGPGEAKEELKKRLKKHQLGSRVVGVETADKMTDRQIEAKVRSFFHEHDDRSRERARPLR